MNLKRAKRLRKAVRLVFAPTGDRATRYTVHRVRGNVKVDEGCERGLYLKLKGAV